jgi:subtilase family serine protease
MGAVDSNLQLNSMALIIPLDPAQKNELAALLRDLQDRKSPLYHKFLTPAQFAARFGPTEADLNQLKAWLTSQGFTVKGVSNTHTSISFSGKVWQVESALHTQIHQYKLNGETHIANATPLHIPAQFAGVVTHVTGLAGFRPKAKSSQMRPRPNFTFDADNHFLSPGDWATIYNLTPVYQAGFDGTGTHIGVIGQTYAPLADIDNFRAAAGLPATKLNYVCISDADCATPAGTSTAGDLGEADLDIEWAGGIAPNATIDFIYAAFDDPNQGAFEALIDAVGYTATDGSGVVPVISISYGACETLYSVEASLLDQYGQVFNALGQTVVAASGDSGAAGCDDPSVTPAAGGLSVDIPADSTYYTAVGGTILSGDEAVPSTYWLPPLPPPQVGPVNSAIMYIPEEAYNDQSTSGGLYSSGGGESTLFGMPSYQSSLPALPTNSGGRLVPDLAFSASSDHDAYLFCSSSLGVAVNGPTCSNGFLDSTQSVATAGGTSAPTPAFAGVLALLVQRYGPLGNVNPALYAPAYMPATYAATFNDITSGNNIVQCSSPSLGCVTGTMGYTAGTGYDEVTGLGSLNGFALYSAFATNSTYANAPTAIQISLGTNPVALGSSDTMTVQVTSTSGGIPSGTLTFNNIAASFGGVATLTSAGTYTLSFTANSASGFTLGSNPITVNYTPAAGAPFLPSTGTAELTVVTSLPGTSAPPVLFALSSNSGVSGGASFTLSVFGDNFTSSSVVLWNGAVQPTTFVSSTQLNVQISEADIAVDGTYLVSVSNPSPNPGTSIALPFAAIVANPVPAITGASLSVPALTVTGKDFVPNAQVLWNGTPLTTTYISPGILSATIPSTLTVTLPATLTVGNPTFSNPAVINPAGTSAGFTLQ